MSQNLISIIVPVYKVEPYIDRCISSIVNQTYTNLEIILVDDGSPDNCPQMCDKWAEADSRIKVIHKANGGLSSARNAGIDIATGELIGFVDSDDAIELDMYEKMERALCESNAEMCICGIKKIDENSNRVFDEEPFSIPSSILTKEEAFEFIDKWYYVTVWNKLYKKHVFDGCRFPEGKIHEDEFIIHYLINNCCKMVTISDELYIYLQRSSSIMGETLNINHLDAIYAFTDRYDFFIKNKSKQLAINALRRAYGLYIYFTERYTYKTFKKPMKKAFRHIFWKLLFCFDLRAIKLMLIHIKYSLKG